MKKTNKLFDKYLSLFLEQEPGEEAPTGEAPGIEAPAEPEPLPGSEMSDNEKHVIKILTNAFIFNPTLFSPAEQKKIRSKINDIKRSVNVPISKIADDIKNIIALDRSLVIETKTERLLDKYLRLIEQDSLDATEPQSGETNESQEEASQGSSSKDNINSDENKLNLVEIFPLYKELILSALAHIPTEEELLMLRPVVNEFGEADPQKIVDTVKNILGFATEDNSVEDALSNA